MLRSRPIGFTLVELLVVVGIIALLIGLLIPALSQARESANATVCASNLKQIAFAVQAYGIDFKGALHNPPDGWQWVTTTIPTKLIATSSTNAYWGVAYLPYVAPPTIFSTNGNPKATVFDAARRVFNCPSERVMSTCGGKNTDSNNPGHYGINWCITGKSKSSRWAKISRYKRPSETIFCHDAIEQRLDGSATYNPDYAGDMLSSFGGAAGNLLEWRPGGEAAENEFPGSRNLTREYYRHSNRCQVLWLDGHVSSIARSDGRDIPAAWYWGQESRPQ